ncbi:hypothetical protein B0T25DRAFT_241485 [Lasiosphaeria hispida]|uniref:Uncharacterized protein n=1 Tax=Lasiosphaeria hispida TaxID=260671 RepID=A0AAJ0HF17_9PEZI|nr:hypothetical protein B0T25DRAFT_241485 [Lasiosphaeria hispida]
MYCGRRANDRERVQTASCCDHLFPDCPPKQPTIPRRYTTLHLHPPPCPMQFDWPVALPWLQFQSANSDLISLPSAQQNPLPGRSNSELKPRDVSESLVSTFLGIERLDQRPSVSRLATTIGTSLPESYRGGNLTRADIILNGSVPDLLRESITLTIFGVSNNSIDLHDHNIWEPIRAILLQFGVVDGSLNPESLGSATLSAFTENLFIAASYTWGCQTTARSRKATRMTMGKTSIFLNGC